MDAHRRSKREFSAIPAQIVDLVRRFTGPSPHNRRVGTSMFGNKSLVSTSADDIAMRR
jgi:hypothetical protein